MLFWGGLWWEPTFQVLSHFNQERRWKETRREEGKRGTKKRKRGQRWGEEMWNVERRNWETKKGKLLVRAHLWLSVCSLPSQTQTWPELSLRGASRRVGAPTSRSPPLRSPQQRADWWSRQHPVKQKPDGQSNDQVTSVWTTRRHRISSHGADVEVLQFITLTLCLRQQVRRRFSITESELLTFISSCACYKK